MLSLVAVSSSKIVNPGSVFDFSAFLFLLMARPVRVSGGGVGNVLRGADGRWQGFVKMIFWLLCCGMVSHAVDGISSSGMKEGLARRCSWAPLPPSGFGVRDTRSSAWVDVLSSSLFCCCCEIEDGPSVVFNAGVSLLPVKCSLVVGAGFKCWPWKTSTPSLSCVVLVLLGDGEARSSEVSLILFAILTFGVDSNRCCFGMEESSFVEVCIYLNCYISMREIK